MKRTWCGKSLLLLAAAALNIPSAWAQQSGSGDWKVWGGDPGVSHFSTLDQINTKNVSRLKPAWVYDSGKFGRSWEDTPLLINGLLYVIDAGSSDVIALEPETGKQVWRHKAPEGQARDQRALAYWGGDGYMKPRLIMTWGSNVHGIDPATGKSSSDWPSQGFNIMLPRVQGVVQGANLGACPIPGPGGAANIGVAAGSGARPNSGGESGGEAEKVPPVIYKNLIIVAGASGFLPPPGRPGDVRAYDLKTGKLVWQNRLIPDPGQPGADSWANPDQVLGSSSWGFLSLDEATGTVYVPTDSGSPGLVGV